MESQVRGIYGDFDGDAVETWDVYVFVSGGGTVRILFANGRLGEFKPAPDAGLLHVHGLDGCDGDVERCHRDLARLLKQKSAILADGNR